MAIARVQTKTWIDTLISSTAAAWTSNTTTGNLIVVAVIYNVGIPPNVSSITDSQSNTYTRVLAKNISGRGVEVWYAKNITGGTTPTVTVNFNTQVKPAIAMREYSGLDTVSPLDVSLSQNNSAVTSHSSGITGTTAQANELVFGAIVVPDQGVNLTAGSGYSNLAQIQNAPPNPNQVGIEDKIVAATSTQEAVFSTTSAVDSSVIVASFREAGGITTSTSSTSSSISTSSTSSSISTSTSRSTSSSSSTSTTLYPNCPNDVVNPSFETGSGTTNANFSVTGWVQTLPANATVITIQGTQVWDGLQAIQIAVDATNSNNGIKQASASKIPVVPSTPYTFSVYVKASVAGALAVQLSDTLGKFVQTDGTTWNSTATYQEIAVTTSWVRYTFTFTTASDQTFVLISDLKRSSVGSQTSKTFWVDAVQLEMGASATSFCPVGGTTTSTSSSISTSSTSTSTTRSTSTSSTSSSISTSSTSASTSLSTSSTSFSISTSSTSSSQSTSTSLSTSSTSASTSLSISTSSTSSSQSTSTSFSTSSTSTSTSLSTSTSSTSSSTSFSFSTSTSTSSTSSSTSSTSTSFSTSTTLPPDHRYHPRITINLRLR